MNANAPAWKPNAAAAPFTAAASRPLQERCADWFFSYMQQHAGDFEVGDSAAQDGYVAACRAHFGQYLGHLVENNLLSPTATPEDVVMEYFAYQQQQAEFMMMQHQQQQQQQQHGGVDGSVAGYGSGLVADANHENGDARGVAVLDSEIIAEELAGAAPHVVSQESGFRVAVGANGEMQAYVDDTESDDSDVMDEEFDHFVAVIQQKPLKDESSDATAKPGHKREKSW